MFFRGFLIGLVAGVWLTVLYLIITTRGEAIRAYFHSLRKTEAPLEPVPQMQEATMQEATRPAPEPRPEPAVNRSTTVTRDSNALRDDRLEPENLSAYGAAKYRELIRLVHDEQRARRLVQLEADLRPDADIDESISIAVDKVLRDRGALLFQQSDVP